MATFSALSKKRLLETHPDIQRVMNEAIKSFDFSVICGYRNKADQEKAFASGNSKAHFLQSPHNYKPSVAVDIVPNPLDWNDLVAFLKMGVHVMGVARLLKVPMRWGADWNMNGRTNDERFKDFPHFELHPWRKYAKGA